MTTVALPPADSQPARWALRDAWTLTRRELDQLRHEPGELVGAVVFNALLVVMFGYVFGSAIAVPSGGNYREYLMPGLFAMTAMTGVMINALAVSKDIALGVMDRFRTLPMSRLAVPLGRAILDLLMGVVGLVISASIGLVVGWSPHRGVEYTVAAFALIVLMRFALCWVGIVIGMAVKPGTADALVPLVFPVSILSNSFVPTSGLPVWLRVISEWNPVSALVQATRALFGNPGGHADTGSFPLTHPYLMVVGWSVLLILVFATVAMRRFTRAND